MTTAALRQELTANTDTIAHVFTALVALGEEQCLATRQGHEARVQGILEERQPLLKVLEVLLYERQQWRDALQHLPDEAADKMNLMRCLMRDDAALADNAQRVLHLAREAEALLRSAVEEVHAQLQVEHHRQGLTDVYQHPSALLPRFVDKTSTA